MFKKYRSIRLPYEKQGYIYFQCRNYSALPPGQRQRIRRTCAAVADRYADALFAFLTTDRNRSFCRAGALCEREHAVPAQEGLL